MPPLPHPKPLPALPRCACSMIWMGMNTVMPSSNDATKVRAV